MGSAASIPADRHIVVVGAGYGGTGLALQLLKAKANFTLVSPGDSFHHNIAAVRAVCVPGWAEKTLVPLETTFGAHFKQAKVTEIKPEDKKVVLSTGDELSYDTLVIATGCVHSWPFKLVGMGREDVFKQYDALIDKVKSADRVAVIGGGATGVEVAAEVAAAHPEKEVSLVHGSEWLINDQVTQKGQNKLRNMLEKDLGIKLVLGERVSNLADITGEGPATIQTDKGTTIEADVVFRCTGLRVDPSAYENGLKDSMEENGSLKVNEFLQVQGQRDIYALGDCSNVNENKLAFHAGQQSQVLFKTLCSVPKGGKPVAYKPGPSPMAAFVSVGPDLGFGQLKAGFNVPSFVAVGLKSKKLMVDQTWKDFNQKMTV